MGSPIEKLPSFPADLPYLVRYLAQALGLNLDLACLVVLITKVQQVSSELWQYSKLEAPEGNTPDYVIETIEGANIGSTRFAPDVHQNLNMRYLLDKYDWADLTNMLGYFFRVAEMLADADPMLSKALLKHSSTDPEVLLDEMLNALVLKQIIVIEPDLETGITYIAFSKEVQDSLKLILRQQTYAPNKI